MARRHNVNIGVIAGPEASITAGLGELLGQIRSSVWKRLAILMHGLMRSAFRIHYEVCDLLTLHRHAVYIYDAVDHLDAVTRQADKTLDVIGGIVMRRFENDNIASF